MLKSLAKLAPLTLLVGVLPAHADLAPTSPYLGTLQIGTGYLQAWFLTETGHTISSVEASILPGSLVTFTSPIIQKPGSPCIVFLTPSSVGCELAPPEPDNILFGTFHSSFTDPFEIDFTILEGSAVLSRYRATYDGAGDWAVSTLAVPEPNTAFLRISWLAGFGMLLIRARRGT